MSNPSSSRSEWNGIVFIGDPHLSSRVPGFRSDDYPHTALRKLEWSLNHAEKNGLLPIMLGDLFDRPRDNANWLVGELLALLAGRTVLAIHGNHDCRENQLTDDDTFSIILKSEHLTLLDAETKWSGQVNGRSVIVGGSSWGHDVPESFSPDASSDRDSLVIWITHHDISFPESSKTPQLEVSANESTGKSASPSKIPSSDKNQQLFEPPIKNTQRNDRGITPAERPGIDLVVNGHIHTRHEMHQTGSTSWAMPGNLVRLGRSKTSRTQPPSIMELEIHKDGWQTKLVEVPHEPFDDVFLEASAPEEVDDLESSFVRGLAELQARRTESGAGLVYFLQHNLNQFDQGVAEEVVRLAEKVTSQDIDLDWSQFVESVEQEPELTGLLTGLEQEADSTDEPIAPTSENELSDAEEAGSEDEDQTLETPRQKMLF
jgi:DNA repair exonuclease SbcCD nuclease subunit